MFLSNKRINLVIFGQPIQVQCHTKHLAQTLSYLYQAFLTPNKSTTAKPLFYQVRAGKKPQEFVLLHDRQTIPAGSFSELLFIIEKNMTIKLQTLLPQWYFIHACVVAYRGSAVIIAAPSGTGKSTTAWALLHNGFDFISDELAPIDLEIMTVAPYPRALGLKNRPPAYALPEQYLALDNGYHIGVKDLPASYVDRALPLKAIYCLSREAHTPTPQVTPLATSVGAMQVYANTLNALAHSNKGLTSASRIASQLPCFTLAATSDLPATCETLKHSLDNIGQR